MQVRVAKPSATSISAINRRWEQVETHVACYLGSPTRLYRRDGRARVMPDLAA